MLFRSVTAIRGCEAAVSGCKGSVRLYSGELGTDCSILCDVAYDSASTEYVVDFSTFGFSPTEPKIVTFVTALPDGTTQTNTRDIGPMLSGDDRQIVPPIEILYSKPINDGDGGFSPPVVGDWDPKYEYLEM